MSVDAAIPSGEMLKLSTADMLEAMAALDPDAKRELDAILMAGNAPIWVPQDGPQLMAYLSEADIVFYGGAAGGGKTDLLLGVSVTSQEHSIIFRREAVQLIGIEERMTSILGTRKGYNSQTGVWRLPGDRVMELGSVKEPGDWIKYQGRPHDAKCVGRGTPVLMADGTYKAIELLTAGDTVATLDGPKTVTRTISTRKPAVLATAKTNGEVTARQVQSTTHEILFASGWASQCTKLGRVASSPTPHCCVCRCGELSLRTFAPSSSSQQGQYLHEVLPLEQQQDHAGYQSLLGSCVGAEVSAQESGSAESVYLPSAAEQHSSESAHQEHPQPCRKLSEQGCAEPSCGRDVLDALSESSLADSSDDCSICTHPYGEQPRDAQVHALQGLLLLAGAAPQIPKHSAACGQVETPTHNPRAGWYCHPYTKEIRQTLAEFSEASLEFQDVGEQDLFDLTVESANHYITAGGIINKNCFDEICHFTEGQFRTLIGWLRTDNPSIRQRVIAAGNPPTDASGEWVVRFWAPWLDPQHPNPAKPGELRWYVMNDKGEDQEVADSTPVMVGGELMQPKSRTFIPSSVDDNLFLLSTGYKATLQSLPEPLRSQMLRGDFMAGAADPAWQAIPTEWVKAAMARWKPRDAKGPMTALGFDPARGGIDKSSLSRRHGQWFDEVVTAPGIVTKDGPTAAGFVVPYVRDGACVCVDSIGIGSSALDFIKGLNLNVLAVNGSEASAQITKAGNLRYRNRRAEMYWRLREELDPTNPYPISLPPDRELAADLTAVRYKVVTMGKVAAIQMRSKDEIREVLGRSPDKGDSVAQTFVAGIPDPNSTKRKPADDDYDTPDWRVA